MFCILTSMEDRSVFINAGESKLITRRRSGTTDSGGGPDTYY